MLTAEDAVKLKRDELMATQTELAKMDGLYKRESRTRQELQRSLGVAEEELKMARADR